MRLPGALGAALILLALATPAAGAGVPETLRLGSQTLTLCGRAPVAYCGRMEVPLQRSSPQSPDITIAYRFYPASAPPDGHALGTVVPVEGGPGYASVGSVAYTLGGQSSGYAPMYGPLLARWNMLVVDNRGTGASTPIRCPALQSFSGPTGTSAYEQAAAACATALDEHWRYGDGGFVHASDLFTSAPAADDLAQVIEALGVGPVDLYGDSYGSWFAQVFAARHPGLLRSLILDSTYQVLGLEPWYLSSIDSMAADFDAACGRWEPCAGAALEGAWAQIAALAARLRRQPISAFVPGPSGGDEEVHMEVVGLVNLVNDAAGDAQIYRELPAAARALLDAGDPAPLARLYAQRLAVDEAYSTSPVREYSEGLYLAVSCLDYPQLFSMGAAPAQRALELRAAEQALPPESFAPFTTAEWLAQDQNTEAYTACLDWPAPVLAEAPVQGSAPLLPATLPVLVLGAELDTWTPPAGVPAVLAQLGARTRFVEVANATHVVGEGDTECGSQLVREFVEDPSALAQLDTSCAGRQPPIHAVGVYPATLAEEPELAAASGSQSPAAGRRLAAAAVQTAGDAIARYAATEARVDTGLEGGSATASHGGGLLTLLRDRLIAGVPVSGTVALQPAPVGQEGSEVQASLTARAGRALVRITASWSTAGAAPAAVQGIFIPAPGDAGLSLAGSMPAP